MPATAKAQAKRPPVYADQNHDGKPICLDCFLRLSNEVTDPDAYDEWVRIQGLTQAAWENMSPDLRQRGDFDDPNGWVKLLLDSLKWPRSKGRCWACSQQLALYYRLLVEETQGASGVREFRARCQAAAAETNTLALEVAASGYRPIVRILNPDPKYGHLPAMAAAHVASLEALLIEPELLPVQVLWKLLNRQIQKVLRGETTPELNEKIKYEPLKLGAPKLWELAVALKQIADMGSFAERNFSGVVRTNTKDPHNPPERLALVAAYQEAQKMIPPMGYGELAKVLIEHEVVDGKWWGDDIKDLQTNIQRAVKKYRPLMPLRAFSYAGQGGTTLP